MGSSLVCANHHTFDRSRAGYVNLLAGRQKSGLKGDTPAMLSSRRRFLEHGFYEPLRGELINYIAKIPHHSIAEIGCGEGYYIGGLCEQINDAACYGTDIAKAGVLLAAKRYPQVHFAVADTNQLIPLPTHAIDVLLDIFAPRHPAEFARILNPTGHLLVVIPTERHLAELRAIQPLLAVQAQKRRAVEQAMGEWFHLTDARTVTVPLQLDGPAIAALISMTPNAWFLTSAQQDQLAARPITAVAAEFELLNFQPR